MIFNVTSLGSKIANLESESRLPDFGGRNINIFVVEVNEIILKEENSFLLTRL